MRVLAIDDNASSRRDYTVFAETMSLRVTVAASGEEGKRSWRRGKNPPSHIGYLMDWKMPGWTGSKHLR